MQDRTVRRVRRCHLAVAALAALALAAPVRHAAAQVSVGGYLGGEFDNKDHWLLYGADVRVPLATAPSVPVIGQARLTYHPYGSEFSSIQVDANLLLPLALAHPGQFSPYVGAGAAFIHTSGGGTSDSKAGLNLITGTDVDFAPGSTLFGIVQTQYTIARDFPNSYTLVFGLGVHLGGSGGTKR